MNKNIKTALIIGSVIVAVLIILSLVPGLLGQGYGYGMMGPWMMFGGMWFMPIIIIVFWGLVIWGIVALVRRAGCGCYASPGESDSALEILKRRYARGEISKEEFEAKKKDLA